jgi:hypothetical protein
MSQNPRLFLAKDEAVIEHAPGYQDAYIDMFPIEVTPTTHEVITR